MLLRLLGFLIMASPSLRLWTNLSERTINSITVIFYFALLLAAIYEALTIQRRESSRHTSRDPILILLAIYCIIIIVSAVLPSSIVSFDTWSFGFTTYTSMFVGSSLLVYRSNLAKAVISLTELIKGFFWGAAFVLFSVVIFGSFTEGMSGARFYAGNLSPSIVGRNALFIIITDLSWFLSGFRRRLTFTTVVSVLAAIMLVFSMSRSSIIAGVFCIIALLLYTRRYSKERFIFGLILAVALTGVIYYFAGTHLIEGLVSYLELGQGSVALTLTGRTFLWEGIIPLIRRNPLFGYGYGAPQIILGSFPIWGGNAAGQAHNAWLQSLLNVGVVGSIVLFLIFSVTFGRLYLDKRKDTHDTIFMFRLQAVGLFWMLLLRGISESSFATSGSLEVTLLILMVLGVGKSLKAYNGAQSSGSRRYQRHQTTDYSLLEPDQVV